MKKMVNGLAVAVVAFGIGVAGLESQPLNVNGMSASETATKTAHVLFSDRGQVIKEQDFPINDASEIIINKADLPDEYVFDHSSEISKTFRIDGTGQVTVDIVKDTQFETPINFIDIKDGQVISSQTITRKQQSAFVETDDIHAIIPEGYWLTPFFWSGMESFPVNATGATDVYVANELKHSVTFVNAQNQKVVSTEDRVTSREITPPDGYVRVGDTAYTSTTTFDHGKITQPVRPDYSNRSVPIKYIDEAGNVMTGTISFDVNEEYSVKDFPEGYDPVGGSFPIDQMKDSGIFEVHVKKIASNNLEAKYEELYKKYEELLKRPSGTTIINQNNSDLELKIAALQKQLDQLTAKQTLLPFSGVGSITVTTPLLDGKLTATKRQLTQGTAWKINGMLITGDGTLYYNVGRDQYVAANAVSLRERAVITTTDNFAKFRGVATIKYVPGYGIQLWGNRFSNMVKDSAGDNKKLAHGSRWQVFGIAVHNGNIYYDLGGQQYIDASYAKLD